MLPLHHPPHENTRHHDGYRTHVALRQPDATLTVVGEQGIVIFVAQDNHARNWRVPGPRSVVAAAACSTRLLAEEARTIGRRRVLHEWSGSASVSFTMQSLTVSALVGKIW